ncbi:hypothetical protein C9374_001300 [Naegleria lovaniensis]|uniref:TFIIS N-terminal domain-containing protein n=1 Tax=Naegleria lovaniensis TaxID=51637 RepID=A0AA88GSS3_NAELO|nr:uncharacterized protein C9374_001300 [Naegleria lovaniensis]KAG2387706.1 hypothetical protein C9374_001300 [Naegleria lovaniensis]
MSYAPTQIQHTDSDGEGSEAENDTATTSLTQSNIATQVQDDTNNEEGDTIEFDEDDDDNDQASEHQKDDNMNTTADDDDDEEDINNEENSSKNVEEASENQPVAEEDTTPIEFDQEEEEEKTPSKKKRKKKDKAQSPQPKEKQRRKKKDNDEDYKESEEEEENKSSTDENAGEEEPKKKKRKRLQKSKDTSKEKSKEKKKRKKKDKSEPEVTADAENETSLVHDDDEENEPLEKATKSRKIDDDDEFNIVLKEVKSASRRSTQTEQLDTLGKDQAKELVARINAAYEDDAESFFKKKPALHKLQLLPELTEACKKVYLQGYLIEEGILKSLERWLVPEKKDLPPPNINIQTGVLNILYDLPVSKSIDDDEKVCITKGHLKSCRIAKAVKQIANNPNAPANNRKIAKKIVEKWSRLVYQLPSEYREAYKHRRPIAVDDQMADEHTSITPKYATASKSSFESQQPPRKKKLANTNSIRASIPKKESFDFVRLPPSKEQHKKTIVENETHKRLLSVGSSSRRK